MRALVAYAVIAVLTFGYAATNPRSGDYGHGRGDPVSALMAGSLWPLYWSWEAFDLGRAALSDEVTK